MRSCQKPTFPSEVGFKIRCPNVRVELQLIITLTNLTRLGINWNIKNIMMTFPAILWLCVVHAYFHIFSDLLAMNGVVDGQVKSICQMGFTAHRTLV